MPNSSKSLILCVHAHQPVGNFEHVFAEAYERSYLPFFGVLGRHPSVAMSCHFSGSLLDWIEKNRPEFIELLQKLSRRGQIEFLGGAYYEPIYGVIASEDLTGQIWMMRAKVRKLFGAEPAGAWLTERVWDPGIVKPMREAGVEYTILDDLHFEKAGHTLPVTGYYQTKSDGQPLDLFASMKELRYAMPFRKAEEAFELIRNFEAGPADALVFADDCEKFGFWPGTYSWVYTEGWLEKFFTLIEENKEIAAYTFGQFRKQFKPKGLVRIPQASYSEMMEWSGGCFHDFFEKYPESRYFKDRMLRVSKRIRLAFSRNGHSPKIAKAVEALYKAQCNCAYWHGVFGGLYLHHLRSAVFENLIQADRLLAEYAAAGGSPKAKRQPASIEKETLDSGPRWLIRQKKISSYFNPRYGGALEELDFIPKSVNLTCTLRRIREPYHETVLSVSGKENLPAGKVGATQGKPLSIHQMLGAKESHLGDHLFYDTYRRLSLLDHFFGAEIALEQFLKSSYSEAGDFVDTTFKASVHRKNGAGTLALARKGSVLLKGKKRPVALVKTVTPKGDDALSVSYTLRNDSFVTLDLFWGVEFNFSIGDSYAAKGISEKNVKEWVFNDQWRGIKIRIRATDDESWQLLTAPIETVSESEAGLEKTFQQLGALFQRRVSLKPKESKEYRLEIQCS